MKKIVFATNNKHKLDEIRKISEGKLEILSLNDINCRTDIPETGTTLEENALIKARFVKDNFGYDCFADDTGLEVKALDGAPGVYSARYAGEDCRAEDNIRKLLTNLEGISDRRAAFRTVIALLIGDEQYFFEGAIHGKIIDEKRGESGFGYDPVFVPDGYEQTFAELGEDIKNNISHRAIATTKLIRFLLKME
ncbi:MAG: XTP/dITP diphosphohydrolase [Bacteroidota bacterium]|jgi:XTP/dITP diphosphohydrolase|nr:XTP/dITP diphosphohydrolase [Bacteroidota bacterium]PLB87098.1 non-canonical purine NTP pyrophosphatase [Dysgonamonadaceae bacterium]HOT64426.1 non-canonical purine NTP diphosphatase [Dysgonamonadaceae bacterium]HOV36336.1 non-canonical purine NTP diphosphatase [Dysgonamonadaceae bacterium]HQG07495.1 non-canonical purine NTP diphosphatase [Dysgonamonadaceae bacterium]